MKKIFVLKSLFILTMSPVTSQALHASPPLRAFKNVQQYNTDKQNQTNHLDSTNIGVSNHCSSRVIAKIEERTCPPKFGYEDGRGVAVYNVLYRGKLSDDGQRCVVNHEQKINEVLDLKNTRCLPLCQAEEKIFYENRLCNLEEDGGNYGLVSKRVKYTYPNNQKYVTGDKCTKEVIRETMWSKDCANSVVLPQKVNEITDNICARGGNCNAGMLVTLIWGTSTDLDLHLLQPNGQYIYHGHGKKGGKKTWSSGVLDVDMNIQRTCFGNESSMNFAEGKAGRYGVVCSQINPIENISFETFEDVPDGDYTVKVENFSSWDTRYKKLREGDQFSVFIAYKKQGEEKFNRVAIYDYKGSLKPYNSIDEIVVIEKKDDKLKLKNFDENMRLNYILGIESTLPSLGNNFY